MSHNLFYSVVKTSPVDDSAVIDVLHGILPYDILNLNSDFALVGNACSVEKPLKLEESKDDKQEEKINKRKTLNQKVDLNIDYEV